MKTTRTRYMHQMHSKWIDMCSLVCLCRHWAKLCRRHIFLLTNQSLSPKFIPASKFGMFYLVSTVRIFNWPNLPYPNASGPALSSPNPGSPWSDMHDWISSIPFFATTSIFSPTSANLVHPLELDVQRGSHKFASQSLSMNLYERL